MCIIVIFVHRGFCNQIKAWSRARSPHAAAGAEPDDITDHVFSTVDYTVFICTKITRATYRHTWGRNIPGRLKNMRLLTAKTSSDSFAPQTQAQRVNVKVNRDRNANITVSIGRAELTVSRLFSKISRASSLLHSSSMHSRSRFPFLLSSNRVLARRCRCRNWEALFCERTAHKILIVWSFMASNGQQWCKRECTIWTQKHWTFSRFLYKTGGQTRAPLSANIPDRSGWPTSIHRPFSTLECHVNPVAQCVKH